jgi:hypothetical protein
MCFKEGSYVILEMAERRTCVRSHLSTLLEYTHAIRADQARRNGDDQSINKRTLIGVATCEHRGYYPLPSFNHDGMDSTVLE